ncbi:hypothetical protein L7F22_042095 [Adiantum nelumboides]|nr:hypothetical protein [Adiantum nelumboides]
MADSTVAKNDGKSISAPTEDQYRQAFDPIIPPVKFIQTKYGKAAYYPITPSIGEESQDRVLLIHGVQTPAIGLYPLAKALQTSFPKTQFVLLDLWGHGLSDTPEAKHEPGLFLTLIDNLLDHLQWNKVKLIGFSFGGLLTIAYSVTRPERVDDYILIAPGGLIRSSAFTSSDLEQLRSDDFQTAYNWTSQWLEGGDLIVPQDWKKTVASGRLVAEAVREWQVQHHKGHKISVLGIVKDGEVMDAESYFSQAQKIAKPPSLVILGEKDDICTREDLEAFGYGNIHVIPNVGHAVVREKVPEVAGLIKALWGAG